MSKRAIKSNIIYKIVSMTFNRIKFILSYSMYFISGFIPRNRKIWVFGSFNGFTDNCRYFYEYCSLSHAKELTCIWITPNRRTARELKSKGINAFYKKEIKALWYCLIAKVYIYNCYIRDINYFTSRNAIKINFWHGLPLKKIEFDITTPPLAQRYHQPTLKDKIVTPYYYLKPDILLSPSPFASEYSFLSAFRLTNDNILTHNYPRTINLLERSKNNVNKNKFTFFYAPTWRDNHSDFIQQSNIDFTFLDNQLETLNSELYIKLHPNTNIDLAHFSQFKNIILVDKNREINEFLYMTDCLITDYSSVYFDYLWLNRPIIFFTFDEMEYISNRELYLDFRDHAPGEICNNIHALTGTLKKVRYQKFDPYEIQRENIFKQFYSINNTEFNSNEALYSKIITKIS